MRNALLIKEQEHPRTRFTKRAAWLRAAIFTQPCANPDGPMHLQLQFSSSPHHLCCLYNTHPSKSRHLVVSLSRILLTSPAISAAAGLSLLS